MGRGRLVAFWSLLVLLVVIVVAGIALGRLVYGKITYPAVFCGSFGQLDSEIGWVLAPNASSCIGGRGDDGEMAFESQVFTDDYGFRAPDPTGEPPRGGIMAIGDSWTFGYGVSFEDSFPGQLSELLGERVAVAASPAYGAAQAVLLARRWVGTLKPRAAIYLDIGFWERSACTGDGEPGTLLKPCYWQQTGSGSATLTRPPPGQVIAHGRWGDLPGGMLGVGEDGWDYFLISRPLAFVRRALVQLGWSSGFGHDFHAIDVDHEVILRANLEHLAMVTAGRGVDLILLDPGGAYSELLNELHEDHRRLISYVGRDLWRAEVTDPSQALPPEMRSVPEDQHFGPGTNLLIAQLLQKRLRERGHLRP